MFEVIALDADDTLWHNESFYTDTRETLIDILEPYHDRDWICTRLYETEIRNLALFGYGIKGFTLSLIETAIDLSEGRVTGMEVFQIIEAGKAMTRAPVTPLDGVVQTLKALAENHRLMVITKGDLFDQESKLARSGLGDFFAHVEVVSEKEPETYRRILEKYGVRAADFLMIGNSLKSDILPVLEIGAKAVHVPYRTTWEHERVPCPEEFRDAFDVIDRITELPGWLSAHGKT